MTSESKKRSNRTNASRSTGPRTPEGKRRSSMNGVKFGLFSRGCLVVAGDLAEDQEELALLVADILEDLKPVGRFEELLADRAASLFWRLRRPAIAEVGAITSRTLGFVDQESAKWKRPPLPETPSMPDYLEPELFPKNEYGIAHSLDPWKLLEAARLAWRLSVAIGKSEARNAKDELLADLKKLFGTDCHGLPMEVAEFLGGIDGSSPTAAAFGLRREALLLQEESARLLKSMEDEARARMAVQALAAQDSVQRAEAHLSRELTRTLVLLDALQRRRQGTGIPALPEAGQP
jgi:hypothetical protein